MRQTIRCAIIVAAVVLGVGIWSEEPVAVNSAMLVTSIPDAMGNTRIVDMNPTMTFVMNVIAGSAAIVLGFTFAFAIRSKPQEQDARRQPGCA